VSKLDVDVLKESIQHSLPGKPSFKTQAYIDEFFERRRIGTKITAKVVGNHGTYTVSIQVAGQILSSVCSCYIGKHGFCHHCEALAKTFLNDVGIFEEVKQKRLEEVNNLVDLYGYLQSVTFEMLITELKANGITQKAFADSIGMNSRHLTAIKSSEQRNRFHNELGATKLACLWILEHIADATPK